MGVVVSVVIPTLNSARSLGLTLESIRAQTFRDVEVIVVDACSTDATVKIADRHARVIIRDTGGTRARLIGAREAKGSFVLNLDSDQALRPNAIESAVNSRALAVAFGETSTGTGLVARMNGLDKRAMNLYWKENLDPLSGFIRPRLFDRDLLVSALRMIPDKILDTRPSPFSDDSLIFLHTGLRADQVAFVPDAITHEEESKLLTYLKKWRTYGRTAKPYRGTPYSVLVTARGRRRVKGVWRLACLPGQLSRGLPFLLGYYFD